MMAPVADRRQGWRVLAIEVLAVGGWASLAYVVLELAPEHLASRLALLGALAVATLTTSGLIAYALSFVLFADAGYRGNLGRALLAGAVLAAVVMAAAGLQLLRSLTPPAVGVLVLLLLAGQVAVLVRE